MLVKYARVDTTRRLSEVWESGRLVIDSDLNNLYLGDGVEEGGLNVGDVVALQGPATLSVGIDNVFTIVNYDAFSQYEVSIDRGTVTREGSTITVEMSVLGGSVDLIVKRNGVGRSVTLPVERDLGPGPTTLVGGDFTAGFFGEVGPEDLITYEGLASQIGLTAGTSQFNAESKWLKFALDDSILFVMLKPGRHTISWDQIHARNAVYGRPGDAEVGIGDYRFKCRLLKGADEDPADVVSGHNPVGTHQSEWNRLIYPIHDGNHFRSVNPILPAFGTWAQYSDADLLVDREYGNGAYSWCQETPTADAGRRVVRGGNGVSRYTFDTSSFSHPNTGWRAVLELISQLP